MGNTSPLVYICLNFRCLIAKLDGVAFVAYIVNPIFMDHLLYLSGISFQLKFCLWQGFGFG